MMSVLPDDDDEKWEGYPGHTRAKHRLLQYYLNPWFKKLGYPNRALRVFDCFSGRGEYYEEAGADAIQLDHINSEAEKPGSPQIILDRAIEYAGQVGHIECVFIDHKQKNLDILRENLPDPEDIPDNVNYRLEHGKFENRVVELIDSTGGCTPPTFFFIDPFGYDSLDYDLITRLGSTERFEILITLMASEVHRWLDVEKQQGALEIPFGTKNWRRDLEQYDPGHWQEKEVGYYCTRLEENGPERTIAYLVTEEDSTAMKYYLVFGTNSDDGFEIMREGMQNCGPGKFAYAPERATLNKNQRTLDAVTQEQEYQRAKEQISTQFAGESKSFNDVVAECVKLFPYKPTYRRKHIREILREMEEDNAIVVNRISSKTERGLGGEDIIQFTRQ